MQPGLLWDTSVSSKAGAFAWRAQRGDSMGVCLHCGRAPAGKLENLFYLIVHPGTA